MTTTDLRDRGGRRSASARPGSRALLIPFMLTGLTWLIGCGTEDPAPAPPTGTAAPEADTRVAPEADGALVLSSGEWLVIEGGWMVDVLVGERVPNPGILISPAGRIRQVGQLGEPVPGDVEPEVITLDDALTILPGLIDVHAHYNMDLTGDGRIEETRWNPLVFLANGVTTTWQGGEYRPELILELRDRIESGEWIGPRVVPSGPYYGTTRPGWDREMTREQIHADVDEWVERGVLHFKAKGAGPEHLEALIERVHHHGGTVAGHVDSGARGSTNSEDAIRMGIDRIEHILGGPALDREQAAYPVWNQVDTTDAAFREIVDLFLDHEVYFDPTITAPIYFTELVEGFDDWAGEREFFTPYVQEQVAARERTRNDLMSDLHEAMKRTTLAFYNAGGGPWITMGTDTPSRGEFLPGFSSHRELHAMVQAGIPPIDALRAGTINGARALNMDGETGSITPGKWADLAIIRGDPLDDIRATRNVEFVLREGVIYDPAELLDRARGRIGPTGPDEHAEWWAW